MPRLLADELLDEIEKMANEGRKQGGKEGEEKRRRARQAARNLLRLMLFNLFEGMQLLGHELTWNTTNELFESALNILKGQKSQHKYLLPFLQDLYACYKQDCQKEEGNKQDCQKEESDLGSFLELMKKEENLLPTRPRSVFRRDYKRVSEKTWEEEKEKTWEKVKKELGGTEEAKGLALALAGVPGGPYGLVAALLKLGLGFLPYLLLVPLVPEGRPTGTQNRPDGRGGMGQGDQEEGNNADPFSLQLIYAWARGSIVTKDREGGEDEDWPLPVEGCSGWDKATEYLLPPGKLTCTRFKDQITWPEGPKEERGETSGAGSTADKDGQGKAAERYVLYVLLRLQRSDTEAEAKLATVQLKLEGGSCRARVGLHRLELQEDRGWKVREGPPLFLRRRDAALYPSLDRLAGHVLGKKAQPLKGFSCFLVEKAKELAEKAKELAEEKDHSLAFDLYGYLVRLLSDQAGQEARGVDALWENLRKIVETWVKLHVWAGPSQSPRPSSQGPEGTDTRPSSP